MKKAIVGVLKSFVSGASIVVDFSNKLLRRGGCKKLSVMHAHPIVFVVMNY
jgi:hypothetical protein